MYQQQVLARSYFEKIKFNKRTRVFRILDNDGHDIISGKLAADLHGRPFQCLPEDFLDDGSMCLEWVEMARMYLNHDKVNSNQNVDCYSLYWKSLIPDWNPVDCFDVGPDLGHWYGLGLLKDLKWPLELSSFEYAPFITGNHMNQQFGNAIKRYFLNSKGAAIKVDETVPLYISMRSGDIEQFCIKSKHDDFAFFNRKTPMPEMQYRICVANNMTILHNEMTQKSLWDGLKEEDIRIIHTLLEEPIWQIPAQSVATLTESALYNYTENVIEMGYLGLGHVLISEFWQKLVGDFQLDETRFPTLENTINILHRRGFQVTFMIQPYISTESPSFAEVVAKRLVVTERGSDGMIPALTRYKSAPSAAMLDVTNNSTLPWIVEKLQKVMKTYSVNSFFLDVGSGYNTPRYYKFNQTLDNPDVYNTLLTSKLQSSLTLIGVSGAVGIPRPPAFLSLPPVNSSWEGLKTTIVAALGYGVIGYPFIIPNPVGGDFLIENNDTRTLTYHSMPPPPLPDIELYIRWMQLATFLPVLRFTHLPSQYKSEVVTEVAKELTAIRTKTVIPSLKNFLNDAMNEGLPLVRPLWMMDPKDVNCLTVDNEFMVGNDILVAPIVEELTFQREVYLPAGVWKDGIDNSLRKGSRWIHFYHVPLDKIAYFIKMPDNTRF